MERILRAVGCDADIASTVADVFLHADLRGQSHQGLHHLSNRMVPTLQNRKIAPNARPRLVKEGPAFAVFDGGRGPGQLVGVAAVDRAVAKAKEAGAAVVGVVNSNDIYCLGYYAERIVRAGCIGIVVTDASARSHPYGGNERMVGTNPMAIGIPTPEDPPFVLDFATSAWTGGLIQTAAELGEPLPHGIAVDPEGRPTTDAAKAWVGAVAPFGGAKGYGLALMIAMLSGPLVGAETGKNLAGWRGGGTSAGKVGNKGHLFLAIDPGAFGDAARFRSAAGAYHRAIRQSRRAPGIDTIQIAGEPEFIKRASSQSAGAVPVLEETLEFARQLATQLGIAPLED